VNATTRETADTAIAAIRGNFPPAIGQPALRALVNAQLTTLESLTSITEAELLKLHGMGPKAVRILRDAMLLRGVQFRS
jgi:hypothetical protein